MRVIISGGGTGGHIFPAIAIADALRDADAATEILFVGAEGRIEMERVPKAGYEIVGLPVSGFARRLTLSNLKFPFRLAASLLKARKVVKDFRPDVAVGVGGYASGPVLFMASLRGVPTLLQEQNSYAGVTNKILGRRAKKICVAYDGMEAFFKPEKILLTGNPVRKDLLINQNMKNEGLDFFGLSKSKKTLLVLGGSGGAKAMNQSVVAHIEKIKKVNDIQIVLQSGKYYYEETRKAVEKSGTTNILVKAFIGRMDLAYAAADVVVARAGAGTISELCLVQKPTILVPSPNVAADHQTKNAMALVKKNAAKMVENKNAVETLLDEAINLINNEKEQNLLAKKIADMAKPDAAKEIADELFRLKSKS